MLFRNSIDRDKIISDFGDEKIIQFRYIKNWMEKPTNGSYPGYEKYIYYWIAFNVFYNLNYFNKNPYKTIWNSKEIDRVLDSIKKLKEDKKNDLVSKIFSICPDYLDFLKNFTLEGYDKETKQKYDLVKSLLEAYTSKNVEVTLKELLNCLYVIRCNVFHGIKEPNNDKQNKLLEQSADILNQILISLLEPYFLNK